MLHSIFGSCSNWSKRSIILVCLRRANKLLTGRIFFTDLAWFAYINFIEVFWQIKPIRSGTKASKSNCLCACNAVTSHYLTGSHRGREHIELEAFNVSVTRLTRWLYSIVKVTGGTSLQSTHPPSAMYPMYTMYTRHRRGVLRHGLLRVSEARL